MVQVTFGGNPLAVNFGENTLEAQRKAASAAASAAAAEVARDEAADLVLPANIFIDVALATAEAAVAEGDFFKIVDSSTGLATVYLRTAGGSTELYVDPTKAALSLDAKGSGESQLVTPYLNTAPSWLAWLTEAQRDLLFNAAPGDEPNLTTPIQAALDAGERVIVAPPGSARGRMLIDRLTIPPAAAGRTIDFGEFTVMQAGPLPVTTSFQSGFISTVWDSDIPIYGGHEGIRWIGGTFIQTDEVHDAIFRTLTNELCRYEDITVIPRDGNWTVMTPDYTTNTYNGTHTFVDGDYVGAFYNAALGALPAGVQAVSYKVINSTPTSLQLTQDGSTPVAFTDNGTGEQVIAYYAAWCFKFGGNDSLLLRPTVPETTGVDPPVYCDGIHIPEGLRGQVLGARVYCGDDAFAVGRETIASSPDVSTNIIDDWLIQGVGQSRRGHLVRVYRTESANRVRNVTFDVKGNPGQLRNGALSIYDPLGTDARTSTDPGIKNINVHLDAEYGDAAHTGVNAYHVQVIGAADVKLSGRIEADAATPDVFGGLVRRSTVELQGLKLKDIGDSLEIDRSIVKGAMTVDGGSSDLITVQDSHLAHAQGRIQNIPDGFSGIKRIAGVAGPSIIQIEKGVSFAHAAGATDGYAVDASNGGYTGSYADIVELADGVDVSGAVDAISRPSSGNGGTIKVGDLITRNKIRNSTGAGFVEGSLGTMPSGWFTTADGTTATSTPSGLTRTLTQGGLVNGHQVRLIRLAGTTTSANGFRIVFGGIGDITAAQGETWRAEIGLALYDLPGSTGLTNVTDVRLCIEERSAAGTLLNTQTSGALPLSGQCQQLSFTSAPLVNASTGRVTASLKIAAANGVAIDVPLGPQNVKLYKMSV